MANVKISALSALAVGNVATGDLLNIVDVSDTTMAATGTNKKITLQSLLTPANNTVTLGADANRFKSFAVEGPSAIGGNVNSEITLYVNRASSAAGSNYGMRLDHDVSGAGSSAGHDVRMTTSGTDARDHIVGLQVRSTHSGTGAMTNMFGGTIGDTLDAGAGTVTNYYGWDIQQPAGTGVITNLYGVRVRDLGSRGATANYAIYTEGTTPSHFGGTIDTDTNIVVDGKVAIGGAVFDSAALRIVSTGLSGAVSQYGAFVNPTFASSATTAGIGVYAKPATAASAFTQTFIAGLYSATATKGAGSTITTAYGLFVEDVTAGATNYAIKTGAGLVSFGGLVTTVASATGSAGFRLPHGAAPTSPVDGDMWTTTAGLFVRINGVTKTVTLT